MIACPACERRMLTHPFMVGFDVVFYFCDPCGKTFSKEADTMSDVLGGFNIKTGALVEVDEKGKPVVIEKRRKEDWVPKKGDRVWVSGKTWSCAGTITGFAKDDPEVPWIKVDKDGNSWDARDLGSVRKLEEGDKP